MRLWNYYLNQDTQCPTVQTHTRHWMQEDKHAMYSVVMAVYVPWLVSSYDAQNGKHWLNSNPPNNTGISACRKRRLTLLRCLTSDSWKTEGVNHPSRRCQWCLLLGGRTRHYCNYMNTVTIFLFYTFFLYYISEVWPSLEWGHDPLRISLFLGCGTWLICDWEK